MGVEGVPVLHPFFGHVSTSFGMMALPYLQRYPWNLTLKKCGKYPRFSESKSVYFSDFLHWFLLTRNPQVTFAEKQQMKMNSLRKQKHDYLFHSWLDNEFKGTVINRTLSYLHFAWRVTWNYAYRPFEGNLNIFSFS